MTSAEQGLQLPPCSGEAPYDAIIFDMDGTLLDTEGLYFKHWRLAAADQGHDLTEAIWHQLLGLPTVECLTIVSEHFGPAFCVDAFNETWRPAIMAECADGVPLMPGAAALLDLLASHNVPMALATSSMRHTALSHLQSTGLVEYFEAVVTRCDVSNGKPHPEPYEKAANLMGLPPHKCLAIEDTDTGARAAIAAGAQTVMVPSMGSPSPDTQAGLTHLVTHLDDVAELISQDLSLVA